MYESGARTQRWIAVAGISAENTTINGRNITYGFPAAGGVTTTLANIDRSFLNVAPELSLLPARHRVAVPGAGRHRLRHTLGLEPHRHLRRCARQQRTASDSGKPRFRCRRRQDAATRRPLQRDRLLRVLPKRARHAVARRRPPSIAVSRLGRTGPSRLAGGRPPLIPSTTRSTRGTSSSSAPAA